jgi:hypothetical protein
MSLTNPKAALNLFYTKLSRPLYLRFLNSLMQLGNRLYSHLFSR